MAHTSLSRGLTDESEILKFLQHGTLVGLLPVPHPILIRKYQANSGTATWFRTYMWGVIYLRNVDPPIWYDTDVKLFEIQRVWSWDFNSGIAYTGCFRKNLSYFGRTFLGLIYIDITRRTCIRGWTVVKILTWEKCGLLAVLCTVPVSLDALSVHCTGLSLSQ